MGMYSQFFGPGQAALPYDTEKEAMEDIQALVDMYLNMAFYDRDIEGERLDMRGVVITPQEFVRALTDWTLKARYGAGPEDEAYRRAVREEIALAWNHVDRRILLSGGVPGSRGAVPGSQGAVPGGRRAVPRGWAAEP